MSLAVPTISLNFSIVFWGIRNTGAVYLLYFFANLLFVCMQFMAAIQMQIIVDEFLTRLNELLGVRAKIVEFF